MAIIWGEEYPFSEVSTIPYGAAKISSTKFVVVSSDYAYIGTVSGDEISFGSGNAIPTGLFCGSVAVLDSTHIVIGGRSAFYDGRAAVGVVSGGTIAFASYYEFEGTDQVDDIRVGALDSTHFVVSYYNKTDYKGYAVIGTVSNEDEIAYGTEVVCIAGGPFYLRLAVLDSTHFVQCYDTDGTNAKVGTVSGGNSISFGNEYQCYVDSGAYHEMTAMDATHFVIIYNACTAGQVGWCVVGVVSSGNVITFGDNTQFWPSEVHELGIDKLDSTNFALAFQDYEDANKKGFGMIGTIANGDEISYSDEYEFNAVETENNLIVGLDDSNFAVCYRDEGGADYGIARIGVLGKPAVTLSWGVVL